MNWREVAKELRSELSALGPCRPGRRVPSELRARLIDHFQERGSIGYSQASAAQELGIRLKTMQRWMLQNSSSSSKLVPVMISQEETATGISMVLPNGVRVEGLDVPSVAQLLRELS